MYSSDASGQPYQQIATGRFKPTGAKKVQYRTMGSQDVRRVPMTWQHRQKAADIALKQQIEQLDTVEKQEKS